MENITLEKRRVFISYCHKDTTEEWIDKLATALGQYGIECIADIYDLKLGQDLNYFMEQIKKVDKVLILMGKTYKEKADEREGGVGTETQIISNDVYKNVMQIKFVPIVIEKDENYDAYIPNYLEGKKYTDFSDDNLFANNIVELAKHLHALPNRVKPPVISPPQSLIQRDSYLAKFSAEINLAFFDLEDVVLKELESLKCTYEDYKNEEDEVVIRKINNSKEARDFYVKNLWRLLGEGKIIVEELVSFFEKAYSVCGKYSDNPHYNVQNDASYFLMHELIIYTVASLYKQKKYVEVSQLIKTTYFPASDSLYVNGGIKLEEFYFHLDSLEDRNRRLKLNRVSLYADMLMQRATVEDMKIDFDDIRLADVLIFILSEWYWKNDVNYGYWYPATIVYSRSDSYLMIKKYLVSKSRFKFIQVLFGVNSESEFVKRYQELNLLIKGEKRRVGNFIILPSVCSIVKEEELFSKE